MKNEHDHRVGPFLRHVLVAQFVHRRNELISHAGQVEGVQVGCRFGPARQPVRNRQCDQRNTNTDNHPLKQGYLTIQPTPTLPQTSRRAPQGTPLTLTAHTTDEIDNLTNIIDEALGAVERRLGVS